MNSNSAYQSKRRTSRFHRRCSATGASTQVDMTSMVDVTFLLLIFFVVTASFQLQKAIGVAKSTVDAPSPSPETPPELVELEVQVDQSGSFRVLADQWQTETPSKQALTTQLRQWRSGQPDDARLLVTVDQSAKLQWLVDAMDAGTLAGFNALRIESVEAFP